ncbi:glycerophosphodiester phosphodiesterase [Bacillaceae bacterium SIJ1]|uniref:glycerophosphodiester phosphodiesterase n=1 Tax=Litoribacterium kuwaitense TaxID=1398745 RepID=UPI0013E9D87B|nr:glycerophosphodiester phosphodiesterase [Litoribacterium kuwaitense]NGP44436.1 glycerophosphodiester phosphodiesterase [Litoribacterium kuwaitense]
MNQPLIIAHRGASASAPENTLAAFTKAVADGANAIELDVHLTKDNELAVIHDDTVDRTTNGTGLVGQMTLAELQELDAGSWFSDDFQGEKIPSLTEVFAALPSTVVVNVEIKNVPCYYEGIEARLAEVISKTQRWETTVVSSFDHNCLQTLAGIAPNVKLGLLYAMNAVHHDKLPQTLDVPVYSLHPMFKAISKTAIKDAMDAGYQVYPWTIDATDDLSYFIEAGASGLITNVPAKAFSLLNS